MVISLFLHFLLSYTYMNITGCSGHYFLISGCLFLGVWGYIARCVAALPQLSAAAIFLYLLRSVQPLSDFDF